MRNKVISIYIIIIVVCSMVLLILQIYSRYQLKMEQGNLEEVYYQSTKFLEDIYNKNLEDAYKQLEPRNNILLGKELTVDEWRDMLDKEVDINPLIEIIKPKNSSDISYTVHSEYPNETYVVKFTLLVNYLGKNMKRTGEIEYVEISNGFKVHRFSIDSLGDKDKGRMTYYLQQ